jgi:diguanylate cyclase (GGDEF)-like protein/excisionase family DNA binding protein/PAS domain S-box-containing protein
LQRASSASSVDDLARRIGLLLADRGKTHTEAVRAVAECIGEAFDGAASIAFLGGRDGPLLTPVAHHPGPRRLALGVEHVEALLFDDPAPSLRLRCGHVVHIDADAAQELPSEDPEVRSVVAVPLRRGGDVVGAIAIARHVHQRAHAAEEVQLLDDLGRRVATALWQERMLESLRNELELHDRELAEPATLPRAILDVSRDGVIGVDDEGRVTAMNASASAILGWLTHEAVGRPLQDVMPLRYGLDDLERVASGRPVPVTTLGAAAFPVRLEISVARATSASSIRTILLRDVTAQSDAQAMFVARAGEYNAIAWLGRRGLEGADVDELLHEAARVALAIFFFDRVEIFEGDPREELISRASADAGVLSTADGSSRDTLPQSDLREPLVIDDLAEGAGFAGERRSGGPRTAVVVGIRLADGRLWGAIAATAAERRRVERHEISSLAALAEVLAAALERRRKDEQMRFRALHDAVTALPNRALLAERVEAALTSCRATGATLALLFLGLDAFRRVKDIHGHAARDDLLVAVARRLSNVLNPDHTLAHFSDDELVVLCEDVPGERGAIELAERIVGAFAEPFSVAEQRVHARVSIGMALSEPDSEVESLLRDAHVAMYAAEDRGGAGYELFDDAMRRRILERHRIEHGLRRALDNGELRMFYQPLISLADRRIVGVEGLVRWQDPQRGLVPPDAFIPVAEETGLILPLGRWVIGEACRQLARWAADASVDVPSMAVNVSARELAEGALPEQVAQTLRRTGTPAEMLTIEVTETSLMVESTSPAALLQDLRDLGVQVVLDDFGSGYSSLNYLKRFPIHGLKVDQGLVGEVEESEVDRQILRAIVAMGAALGVAVLVEGVETREQVHALGGLGCDLMQGFAFARPAPAETITPLLREGMSGGRFAQVLDAYGGRGAPAAALALARKGHAAAPNDDSTVSLGEAAQALGVSASTLRRWADSGRLDVVRTTGGHRRFAVAEVRRLNEEAAVGARRTLRPLPLPTEPLPALADVLAADHDQLVETTARMLYDGPVQGWFASDAGRQHVATWAKALQLACRRAQYAPATEATRRLATEAYLGGASLLEVNALVERFGDAVLRALHEAGAPRPQLMGSRRLFARLRHSALEDAERGAGREAAVGRARAAPNLSPDP